MWRLDDLFGVIPAHPAERLSVVALDRLERPATRARRILETNAAVANAFLASRPELECAPLDGGMIAFPRLRASDVESLCDRLRADHETTVVPGRFFGAPGHFRLALGCAPETLEGGLERLAAALDQAD
jgi:aspartate/methionine/tyrosine aminotransferase